MRGATHRAGLAELAHAFGGLRLVHWKKLLTGLLGRDADIVVREFLDDKVRVTMARDLIEVVFNRGPDLGDAA